MKEVERMTLTKEEQLSMPRCDIEKLKGQIEQLKEENQQLKELLKECKEKLKYCVRETYELQTKIDEVVE